MAPASVACLCKANQTRLWISSSRPNRTMMTTQHEDRTIGLLMTMPRFYFLLASSPLPPETENRKFVSWNASVAVAWRATMNCFLLIANVKRRLAAEPKDDLGQKQWKGIPRLSICDLLYVRARFHEWNKSFTSITSIGAWWIWAFRTYLRAL